jgi:probable F420-dependent oxidoreductase
MEFGVHLPLLAFRGQAFSLSRLVDYAETAERLGFTTLCANDHLIATRPWLDSMTALAAILTKTPRMTLMTTVALPVVRGPVPLAKSLAALDVLSGGRLIAGVGPGSLPQDYALVGIAFEERWKRFDEAIQLLRSLLQHDVPPFKGQFYAGDSTRLEPFPVQEPGVPMWIGSWGSEAGLRRVARLGDGWLASAYHVTPASFVDALARLSQHLHQAGREPERFPHALGSMFYYVTEDRRRAEELLVEVVSPVLGRSVELLRERLPIGTPAECVEKLARLQAAGVRKVFLWPVEDEAAQLTRFREQVLPQLPR